MTESNSNLIETGTTISLEVANHIREIVMTIPAVDPSESQDALMDTEQSLVRVG